MHTKHSDICYFNIFERLKEISIERLKTKLEGKKKNRKKRKEINGLDPFFDHFPYKDLFCILKKQNDLGLSYIVQHYSSYLFGK